MLHGKGWNILVLLCALLPPEIGQDCFVDYAIALGKKLGQVPAQESSTRAEL